MLFYKADDFIQKGGLTSNVFDTLCIHSYLNLGSPMGVNFTRGKKGESFHIRMESKPLDKQLLNGRLEPADQLCSRSRLGPKEHVLAREGEGHFEFQ